MKWVIDISEYEVSFEESKVLKALLFIDFFIEMTHVPSEPDHTYIIFTYGSINNRGNGACITLENNSGLVVEVSLRFDFLTINNQAEYEVMIAGMTLAEEMREELIKLRTYSQLVFSQIRGDAYDKDSLLQ